MKKPELYVVSFSGGKDSTAMLLKLIELGQPVDIILFCDTGLEFPQLYDHIKMVEKNIGRKVTVVKSDDDFEYLFAYKEITHRRSQKFISQYGMHQKGYGWAGPKMRWCTNRLKDAPRERFLKPLREQYDVIEYVGIAADETYRLKRNTNTRKNIRLPLVEWNMTESDCLDYCYSLGYDWGGLYQKMKRVSCWCCPLQPIKELHVLYKDFPSLWAQLKRWDNMTWRKFRSDYSVEELEKRFDFEDKWAKSGKAFGTKVFYTAMKQYIKEHACERTTDQPAVGNAQ